MFYRRLFVGILAFATLLSVFVAPPFLIENTEWSYRRNWVLFISPMILIICIISWIEKISPPAPNLVPPAPIFKSPVPAVVFIIAVCVPILLIIPVLNGTLQNWGIQGLMEGVARLGEALVPAIRIVKTDNIGKFSDAELLDAQVALSFSFFSYLLLFGFSLFHGTRDGKFPFSRKHNKRPMNSHKWADSIWVQTIMQPVWIALVWQSFTGWRNADCTDPAEFFLNSGCALSDGLFLYINVHMLPLGMGMGLTAIMLFIGYFR